MFSPLVSADQYFGSKKIFALLQPETLSVNLSIHVFWPVCDDPTCCHLSVMR